MKLIKVSALFYIKYGVNLELNALKICESDIGIPFVSRTASNNGVSAYVLPIDNIKPNPANTISVSGGGSVLESFLQKSPYYSGRDLFYLSPKKEMTDAEMLYYCTCLRANKYKYNYGRQANKTLKDILIPDITEIPQWVSTTVITPPPSAPLQNKETPRLDTDIWKEFILGDVFQIGRGTISTQQEENINGDTPLINANTSNNGLNFMVNKFDYSPKDIISGNTITMVRVGEGASAHYQKNQFVATDNIIFIRSNQLNIFIAMFLIPLIEFEQFRYGYGRVFSQGRARKSIIRLPIDAQGNPDWQFMEDYIKTLPYSGAI